MGEAQKIRIEDLREPALTPAQRAALERRWLVHKIRYGTA